MMRIREMNNSDVRIDPNPNGQQLLQGFFEGPEKLLEIWFSPWPDMIPRCNGVDDAKTGLRAVPREVWSDMLKIVKCRILTTLNNDQLDSYLLSESSMFVYPHKLILKTCGTTTLLVALPRLLEIAAKCGLHKVWRVFYSRKSFMSPEQQSHPHKDWRDEVEYLDRLFDNGAAYTVGKINGDHWFLYLTSPKEGNDVLISEAYHASHVNVDPVTSTVRHAPTLPPSPASTVSVEDQTVEILMTNLNPAVLKHFYHIPSDGDSGSEGGARTAALSGIRDLYPTAQLDSYLFEPCGFSANALLGDSYFNIHVTPQPVCSYASFESNIPIEENTTVEELVERVIAVFRPGKFSVTVFESSGEQGADGGWSNRRLVASLENIPGYVRRDHILYEFAGYDLVFCHFERRT